VLAVHLYRPLQTLIHSSYADNLKFIKNKPHKDSLKTFLKLGNKLGKKEINQMMLSRVFFDSVQCILELWLLDSI